MVNQHDNHGCSVEDCTRHPLWGGKCRDHIKQDLEDAGVVHVGVAEPKARKKKIDAVEVLTTDAVEDNEERTDVDE